MFACKSEPIFKTIAPRKEYLNQRTKGGVILSEAKDLFLR